MNALSQMASEGARQRMRGEARAEFVRSGARSSVGRTFETGGLRLRFPRSDDECEAVIINTGGGMTGGDRARIEMSVAERARAIVSTQAAEKIYRADGAAVAISARLAVAAEASLVWAPQETILFEGADLRRRLEADVAADASLMIVECAVFGRIAHGEVSIDAAFRDDWRVRREGKLVFAENVRLAHAGATLDRRASGAGARAVATLLFVSAQASERLGALRDLLAREMAEGELEAGASAFDGLLVARLLSATPHRLRAGLVEAMRLVRGREAPRVWR